MDQGQIKRSGDWQEASFRYAAKPHLLATSDGAALEFQFTGAAVALRLGELSCGSSQQIEVSFTHET